MPSAERRRADVAHHLRRRAALGPRRSRRGPAFGPRAGVMPPWFVEKNIGIQNFKNDPSLSDDEIAKIAKWVDSGAPRGNPADMPPPLRLRQHRQVDDRRTRSGAAVAGRDRSGRRARQVGIARARADGSHRRSLRVGRRGPRGQRHSEGRRDQHGGRTLRVSPHDVFERGRRASAIGRIAEAEGTSWPIHEVGRNADIFPPEAGRLLAANSALALSAVPSALERPRDQGASRIRVQVLSRRATSRSTAARACVWATASTST